MKPGTVVRCIEKHELFAWDRRLMTIEVGDRGRVLPSREDDPEGSVFVEWQPRLEGLYNHGDFEIHVVRD